MRYIPDFQDAILVDFLQIPLFEECTPHILVYTDLSGGFADHQDFALHQFVQTLIQSEIHGKTPKVTTAHRSNNSSADLPAYTFDDANDGLTIGRYDVCFLFGISSSGDLPSSEREAIAQFMEDGGGVFATGDHDELGAWLSAELPRVRAMRKWRVDVPDASDSTRLTTNLPGANSTTEFVDQEDQHPQRIFLNYRTEAGGIGHVHPILQRCAGPITHIPDHPHEGECLVPTDLATTFPLGGVQKTEWPEESGDQPVPEMVALAMSHGGWLDVNGKEPVVPRSFITLCAYDGHRAEVGRVITDATWHHFVDINIDGGGTPDRGGALMPNGVDLPEMVALREHWVNMAAWLMPENVRMCLRWSILLRETLRYPLYEELVVPELSTQDAAALASVGAQIRRALSSHRPPWIATAMVQDTLVEAAGSRSAARKILARAERLGCAVTDIADATLGGAAAGWLHAAQRVDPAKIRHEELAEAAARSGRRALKLALRHARKELSEAASELRGLAEP